MKRLLLIDGHNLLFQMFFGMPSRIIGISGVSIHGVIGFVGAVNKMIGITAPSSVAIIFDGEKSNPRKELSADYKANRIDYSLVPDEENPFTQLPYIYEALDYMGIKHAETTICETDDVIATYAKKYGNDNEIIISSFDSDYFQLVNSSVKVLRYRGDSSVICDKEYIEGRYGVSPELYPDFKCLVGDSADNICGIRGIGPKTAAKIINQLGDIDSVISNCETIENPKVRDLLKCGREILLKNKALIKLSGDANIPFTIEDAQYLSPPIKTMDVIREIGLL